jgi:hypothetical protein
LLIVDLAERHNPIQRALPPIVPTPFATGVFNLDLPQSRREHKESKARPSSLRSLRSMRLKSTVHFFPSRIHHPKSKITLSPTTPMDGSPVGVET